MGRDGRTGLEYTMAVGCGGEFSLVVPKRNPIIAAATAWSSDRDAGANFMLVLRTMVERILSSLS